MASAQNDTLYDLNDIYEERPLCTDSDLKLGGTKAGSNAMHALMIKRWVSQDEYVFYGFSLCSYSFRSVFFLHCH